LLVLFGVLMSPGVVKADVCLMAYPTSPCEYHYSSLTKYTVGIGHPLYDPAYDLGGEVLVKIDPIDGDGIALDVYQAPGLTGFVLDDAPDAQGYFAVGTSYDLVIDGYNKTPTTFVNILLVFDTFEPGGCVPSITVDGQPALFDAGLGYYFPIGDLVVLTPVGNAYSDTRTFTIDFQLCSGYRVWGFSDENFSLTHDLPGECFTAFSHDVTVPTEETSWGAVKALYR
jgi:hypothetical protein